MKLNCKQGDLAIIVKSEAGNEGKIVRCLELLETDRVPSACGTYLLKTEKRLTWRVNVVLNYGRERGKVIHGYAYYASDEQLRPLRGDLTQDGTTTTEELSTPV